MVEGAAIVDLPELGGSRNSATAACRCSRWWTLRGIEVVSSNSNHHDRANRKSEPPMNTPEIPKMNRNDWHPARAQHFLDLCPEDGLTA